ncbi:uncharacterized protein LOC119112636 [Pollicipes pollicipes]|uniref:uncharacterized protein LOC119112636 n=1 Tax=Pollicipes pollicipes TaxID=41117 RepID=UPI001884E308|nr:uncharacterized protein LOC119112636 [Pollicipes pollicipes]
MTGPPNVGALLFRRLDGKPAEFHLERVFGAERSRVTQLVTRHGGVLVNNPARHPHAVVLTGAAPGSEQRPPISYRSDTFSTQFVDECASAGRLLDLSRFRAQTESLYAHPSEASAVLLGERAWPELQLDARFAPVVSDEDEQLAAELAAADAPLGRAGSVWKGRAHFTRLQDVSILRLVAARPCSGGSPPTAPRYWQLMAPRLPAALTDHPPLSLWTRFVKRVVPCLAEFRGALPLPALVAMAPAEPGRAASEARLARAPSVSYRLRASWS